MTKKIPIDRAMNVFLQKVREIFPILRVKIPSEKTKTLTAISPIVTRSEISRYISLFHCERSGKIFHFVRPVNSITLLIKSTGTTERAPAIIPSPNLRAPRGELSRYEKIYPQIRTGKKVIIIMGMSENISIVAIIYFRNIS